MCWPEVLRPSGKRDLGAVGAGVVVVDIFLLFLLAGRSNLIVAVFGELVTRDMRLFDLF